jgi:hypothetical protein
MLRWLLCSISMVDRSQLLRVRSGSAAKDRPIAPSALGLELEVETNDALCIINTFKSVVKQKSAAHKKPPRFLNTIPYTSAMV